MLPEVSQERGIAEVEVLGGPHLVLADAGGDDGLALGELVERLDDVLGLDEGALAVVVEGVTLLQLARRASSQASKSP
jgi:hypothetical protein